MKDGIIAETGNSRYLRSIAGFLQQYPTYEAFAAALIAGTLPIDWAGKNPDGWAQQGTDLNKANLLTDATAALMDLGPEATPDQMLAALANVAKSARTTASEAETTADSALKEAQSAQSTADKAQSLADAASQKANSLISYGTSDLTAGTSSLTTGTIYAVYE